MDNLYLCVLKNNVYEPISNNIKINMHNEVLLKKSDDIDVSKLTRNFVDKKNLYSKNIISDNTRQNENSYLKKNDKDSNNIDNNFSNNNFSDNNFSDNNLFSKGGNIINEILSNLNIKNIENNKEEDFDINKYSVTDNDIIKKNNKIILYL